MEEPELVKFLSVGKELGVNGLMDEIVNDTNMDMGDDYSEVQSNDEVENRSQQREVTSKDIVKEKNKRVINDIFQQGINQYGCNECKAVYTSKKGLSLHIRSVHEGVKYDCDHCDYRATTQGSLTTHIKSVHEGVKYDCNQCDYRATRQSHLTRHR